MQSAFDITGDLDTPVSAFMKLGAFAPRFLLESVEGGERLARYSFIGFGAGLEVAQSLLVIGAPRGKIRAIAIHLRQKEVRPERRVTLAMRWPTITWDWRWPSRGSWRKRSTIITRPYACAPIMPTPMIIWERRW